MRRSRSFLLFFFFPAVDATVRATSFRFTPSTVRSTRYDTLVTARFPVKTPPYREPRSRHSAVGTTTRDDAREPDSNRRRWDSELWVSIRAGRAGTSLSAAILSLVRGSPSARFASDSRFLTSGKVRLFSRRVPDGIRSQRARPGCAGGFKGRRRVMTCVAYNGGQIRTAEHRSYRIGRGTLLFFFIKEKKGPLHTRPVSKSLAPSWRSSRIFF